jgi:hypothetical protein
MTKAVRKKSTVKIRGRETAPDYKVQLVPVGSIKVPLLHRKDGSTYFRSREEIAEMRNVVARYQDVRRRGRTPR